MLDKPRCNARCLQCINRFVTRAVDQENRRYCTTFGYDYEDITIDSAARVLLSPHHDIADKRLLMAIMESNGLDPSLIWDGRIPRELR
jgi:hypothetical protein